jgi:glycolate oxidase iron-sulfur subunit
MELNLFVGCMGRNAQPAALAAAESVLHRLGYRVRIPESQVCCGAMHRHNGFPEAADALLGRNADVFAQRPVVGIASACIGELRAHGQLEGVWEICRFLSDLQWPPDVELRPLDQAVAVHEPCSQQNLLHDPSAASDLLTRIPGLEVLALGDNAFCCGAAGTYLLQQPRLSQTLIQPKIEELATMGVDTLVTTNTGCALHLAAGLQEAGLSIELAHPVELIARQLKPAG